MTDLLVSPVEDKMIAALSAGASREDVSTVTGTPVEEAPSMVPTTTVEGVGAITPEGVMNEYFPPSGQEDLDFDLASMVLNAPTEGKTYANRLAAQTLALKEDFSLDDIIITKHESNRLQALEEAFMGKVNRKRAEIQDALLEMTDNAPGEASLNAEAAAILDLEVQKIAIDPIGIEKEVVDSIAPIDATEEMEKLQAFKTAAANDLTKMWDAMDKLDVIADMSGFIFPYGMVLDEADVLKNEEILKIFPDPVNTLAELITQWKSFPVERKQEYWPILKQSIIDSVGTDYITDTNTLKAIGVLTNFLDPDGAETMAREMALDKVFGLIDVVTAAPGILRGLANVSRRAIKSTSIIKSAKEVGNKELAEDINVSSIVDEEVAEVAGVTKTEAVDNAMPFLMDEDIDPSFTNGLSPGVVEKLNEVKRAQDGLMYSFSEEADRLKFNVVNDVDREYVIKSEVSKFMGDNEDIWNELGLKVSDIEVDSIGDFNANIKYNLTDTNTGNVYESGAFDVEWAISDVRGTFKETVKHFKEEEYWATSPSFWSRASQHGGIMTDFLGTVKQATVLEGLTAAATKEIADVMNLALKPIRGPLKTRAQKRVGLVLDAGDEFVNDNTAVRGTVFTPDELIGGIHTKSGTVSLTTDDELSAYYGMRMVADTFWKLNDNVVKNRLKAMNAKGIQVGDTTEVGRIFDTKSSARLSTGGSTSIRMLDRRTGELVNASPELIDEVYDQGYVITKFLEEQDVSPNVVNAIEGEFYNYSIISKDAIQELPQFVTHRKPGYVPKINEGVEYLLKENTRFGQLNGKPHLRQATLRMFSNAGDSIKARAKLIADETKKIEADTSLTPAAKEKEINNLEERWVTVKDRELSPEQMLTESFGPSGGLYTGARSKSDIFYGLRDQAPDRTSAFEAFQHNVGSLGRNITQNEWRMQKQQMWLNTIRQTFGKNADITDFQNTKVPLNTKEGIALEKLRKQINIYTGVPTRQESAFQGYVQRMHDWALYGTRKAGEVAGMGLKNKASVKSLLWLKHSDAASALKAAGFHAALGVGNPVQLYVQGQAAVVALARYPEFAPKAILYAFKMGKMDMVNNIKARPGSYNILNKIDKDTPLLEEVHTQWLKTGMKDSVKTNADVVAMESGVGNSMDSFKRVMDMGLIPYRVGELFNRRTSFTMSYLKFKKTNPGKIPTNEDLQDIISDAYLSMMELGKANAARWQGGPDANFFESVLGVMLQFGQVSGKTIELAAKPASRGGFTWQEKSRISSAQLGLFGVTAVPAGAAIFSGFGLLTGRKSEEMGEMEAEAWQNGAMGVLTKFGLGADVEISSRAALGGQIVDFAVDLIKSDQSVSFWRGLGAGGATVDKTLTALERGIAPVMGKYMEDIPLSKSDITNILYELSQIPASSRNSIKAHIMHNHGLILDHRGTRKLIPRDYNLSTEIMVGLGFSTSKEAGLREMKLDEQGEATLVNDLADVYVGLYNRSRVTGETSLELERNIDYFLSTITNERVKDKVRNQAGNRIFNPVSKEEKANRKWFDRQVLDPVTGMLLDDTQRSTLRSIQRKSAINQPFGPQKDIRKEEE